MPVGDHGSNILAMHASHYCCGDRAAESYKLRKAKVGNRVVKRTADARAIGKIVRKIKGTQYKKYADQIYKWSGKRFAWIVICDDPDGTGHYKTKTLIKIRFDKVVPA